MSASTSATYNSRINLNLGSLPLVNQADDPVLYQELLDIHTAIENLLKGVEVNSDFNIDVALGLIPGYENELVVGQSHTVTNVRSDIWDSGGIMTLPTAPESYEIVSANANDTAGGTGARAGVVTSLDENYVQQITPFVTNGGTVALANMHGFPRQVTITEAGTAKSNVGAITLQVAGGGAVRAMINADMGASGNSHLMVPAGKAAFLQDFSRSTQKNEDVTVRLRARAFGANRAEVSIGDFHSYQNETGIFNYTPSALPEKTMLWFQALAPVAGPYIIDMLAQWKLVDV